MHSADNINASWVHAEQQMRYHGDIVSSQGYRVLKVETTRVANHQPLLLTGKSGQAARIAASSAKFSRTHADHVCCQWRLCTKSKHFWSPTVPMQPVTRGSPAGRFGPVA